MQDSHVIPSSKIFIATCILLVITAPHHCFQDSQVKNKTKKIQTKQNPHKKTKQTKPNQKSQKSLQNQFSVLQYPDCIQHIKQAGLKYACISTDSIQ